MVKTFDVSIADAWAQAYGKPHGDPHSVFATLLGVSRNEAKTLSFRYMYSSDSDDVWAILAMKRRERDGLEAYRLMRTCMRSLGIDESLIPSFKEIMEKVEDNE